MSDILNLINDAIFVSLVNTTLQITLLIPYKDLGYRERYPIRRPAADI